MLGGKLAVAQAPIFDGLSFDPFALFDDGRRPAEVSGGGRHVVRALVLTLVVVVFDEGLDLGLDKPGMGDCNRLCIDCGESTPDAKWSMRNGATSAPRFAIPVRPNARNMTRPS